MCWPMDSGQPDELVFAFDRPEGLVVQEVLLIDRDVRLIDDSDSDNRMTHLLGPGVHNLLQVHVSQLALEGRLLEIEPHSLNASSVKDLPIRGRVTLFKESQRFS